MTVVTNGLKAGERVVVSGQYRLRPGTKVDRQAPPAPVAEGQRPMNISAPFIRRPVATSLLMIAIALLGAGGMAASAGGAAAAGRLPDHQRFGVAPRRKPGDHGVGRGPAARAAIRSDRRRHADDLDQHARVDLDHAAIRIEPQHRCRGAGRTGGDHGGGRQLPTDLPSPPTYRKVNPADSPILVMGVHSDSLPLTAVDDYADTILAQQISQISGVAQVSIGGEQKPSVQGADRPRQARHQGADARGRARRDRLRHHQCRQGHAQRRNPQLHHRRQRSARQGVGL